MTTPNPMGEDLKVVADMLRAEAEECRRSSQNNGEYNAAFWVLGIVLDNLAGRLEATDV